MLQIFMQLPQSISPLEPNEWILHCTLLSLIQPTKAHWLKNYEIFCSFNPKKVIINTNGSRA